MAQINFPSAPTNGQEFTDQNGTVWVYETNKWRAQLMANIAANVGIVDAGGYYTSTEVEGALQEAAVDTAAAQSTADTGVANAATAQSAADAAQVTADTGLGVANTAAQDAAAADAKAVTAGNTADQALADAAAADANADTRVLKSGDTMTGGLVTTAPYTAITLKDELSRNQRLAWVDENDNTFWRFERQNSGNFILARYEPAGTYANVAFIARPEGSLDLGQNTSVAVPDATVDGQALAYGQAGAELADTAALAGASPIFSLNSSSTNAYLTFKHSGAPRSYVRSTSGGQMIFYSYDDASNFMVYTPGSKTMDFGANTRVRVPAPVSDASEADPQAAAVVAFDSVTGRYATQGPSGVTEQGDTGWRDVSSLHTDGWGSTKMEVNRNGSVVRWKIWGLTGASSTSVNMVTMPSGFAPSGFTYLPIFTTNNVNNAAAKLLKLNASVIQADTSLVSGYCEISYHSTDAWPTSLPGTPV